jgi:seryl-tRNA synthetase
MTSDPGNGLRGALEAFETALATPIVSGELETWIDQVRKAWSEVSTHVHDRSTRIHPQEYEQITNKDPELIPQVQKLKAEDQSIERDRQAMNRRIHTIAQRVPNVEPDEEKIKRHVTQLIDDGIAFVGRTRKQEVAAQTWFVEAFNRDRGVAD